jgi:hypothetical protein
LAGVYGLRGKLLRFRFRHDDLLQIREVFVLRTAGIVCGPFDPGTQAASDLLLGA